MPEQLPKVELAPAWSWECPACGRLVFEQGEVKEFDDDQEEREAKAALGVEPWEEGAVMVSPGVVTCTGCLRMFDATAGEEDEA